MDIVALIVSSQIRDVDVLASSNSGIYEIQYLQLFSQKHPSSRRTSVVIFCNNLGSEFLVRIMVSTNKKLCIPVVFHMTGDIFRLIHVLFVYRRVEDVLNAL